MLDPESEMKEVVVEALYKAIDLASSGMAIGDAIKKEIMRVGRLSDREFQKQLMDHVKSVDKIRESVEKGGSIEDAFRTPATGTGVLLYLESVMHSLRIAKQGKEDLTESKRRLHVLNKTRIQFIGGSDNDQISKAVKEVIG